MSQEAVLLCLSGRGFFWSINNGQQSILWKDGPGSSGSSCLKAVGFRDGCFHPGSVYWFFLLFPDKFSCYRQNKRASVFLICHMQMECAAFKMVLRNFEKEKTTWLVIYFIKRLRMSDHQFHNYHRKLIIQGKEEFGLNWNKIFIIPVLSKSKTWLLVQEITTTKKKQKTQEKNKKLWKMEECNWKIQVTLLELGTSSCKAFILSAILSLRSWKEKA